MESKEKSYGERKYSSPEVTLFLFQVLLIFIVVCVCLLNLTMEWGNQNLWMIILTALMGVMTPTPDLSNFSKVVSTTNNLKSVVNE